MPPTLTPMAPPMFNPRALVRLRYEAGLSQEALATSAGVNAKTITRLESGAHEPWPSTLFKIAGALGVNVSQLMSVDEP